MFCFILFKFCLFKICTRYHEKCQFVCHVVHREKILKHSSLYRSLQRYYIGSARELARLCGVCKAPVIQHFSETLSGASTIRSFDQQPRFRETSMRLIDGYSRPKFHTAGAMEWLCIRLDMLSLITFAFSLVFLICIPEGTIDPSKF